MSERLLVREARRRREVFRNLAKYLRLINEVVKALDEEAEVYLFGSVAEDRSLPSSDIDVLIVSEVHPAKVLDELWRAGVRDPFEIHVVDREVLNVYRRRAKLVPIHELLKP